MDHGWVAEVIDLFWKFSSELSQVLECNMSSDCDTALFVHTMHHIKYLLLHTPVLSMWYGPSHKAYDALVLLVHGNCTNLQLSPKMGAVCELFASVEKTGVTKQFTVWKKALNTSLCRMSANYLSATGGLRLEPHHPQTAIDTLIFKELYDLVINKGDKRLAMVFVSMLHEMMGTNNTAELLQSLSMHMHNFLKQVIKRIEESASRKFIRLFFAAAGQCTCHTKCSVYGKVSEIQVLAVCKTCRNTPLLRQAREPRCRRTIASTSFINVCSVDGNTSFIRVPLYRSHVNKSNGQLIYEHWAYTITLNLIGSDSGKPSIYMLCAGGRRTCTNVFLTDSLTKTKCEQCQQGNLHVPEKTCLTETVGNKLAALCDSCIIAACCPLHAPLHKAGIDIWLSILENSFLITEPTVPLTIKPNSSP
jgi:hypothetical protein